MSQLTNPYLAVILAPLAVFLALVYFHVEPDMISLWARFYAFAMLGYVGSRYVGRAPILVWKRNTTPEARNVVGWAIVVVGFMFQIAYGWVFIAYDRPQWLSSQYWVGLSVVASSVPRFPPYGDGRNGLSEIASIVVVIGSSLSVFAASHIPQIIATIKGLWSGALAAF